MNLVRFKKFIDSNKSISNFLKVFVLFGTTALCMWQISLNIQIYMNRTLSTSVMYKKTGITQFPKVSICPNEEFNLRKLQKLGLKCDSENYHEMLKNIQKLVGLDLNMTGKHLMENAGWNLGEVVKSVEIGDFHQEFDPQTKSATFWKREFILHESCYTIDPPLINTSSLNTFKIEFRDLYKHNFCEWKDNMEVIDITSSDCLAIKEKCNSSCQFQKLISFMYSIGIIHSYVNTGNLIESHDINTLFHGGEQIHLEIIEMKKYYGELHDRTKCLNDCVMNKRIQTNPDCYILQSSKSNLPIKSRCPSNFGFLQARPLYNACAKLCPLSKYKKYWFNLAFPPVNTKKKILKLRLSDAPIKEISETLSYTLTNLLSDIGGNLGFFLGSSTFIIICFFISKININEKYLILFKRTIVLLLMMIFTIHTLNIIALTINQNVEMKISLKTPRCMNTLNKTICTAKPSPIEWSMGVLMSRVFRCRVRPHNPNDECIVNYVLDSLYDDFFQIFPYLFTSDLLPCNISNIKSLQSSIVVPNDIRSKIDNFDWEDVINSSKCSDYDDIYIETPGVIPKIEYFKIRNSIDLICCLCGAWGLYFSISMYQLIHYFFVLLINKMIKNSNQSFANHTVISKILLLIFTNIFIIRQLFVYFNINPTQTTIKSPNKNDNMLTITACPIFNDINQMQNKTQISNYIDNFKCQKYQNHFFPVEQMSQYEFLNIYCFSCSYRNFNFTIFEYGLWKIHMTWIKGKSKAPKQIIFTMHRDEDVPILDGSTNYEGQAKDLQILNIFSLSYYNSYYYGTKGYIQCYLDCLKEFQDILPLIHYQNDKTQHQTNNCKKKCLKEDFKIFGAYRTRYGTQKTRKDEFFKNSVSVKYEIDENTSEIEFKTETFLKDVQIREEIPIYSLTQLVNDISSILGAFFGISVVDTLTMLITNPKYTIRYFDQIPIEKI